MLWIGAGGFLGTCLRFAVGSWVQRSFASSLMPVGTLAVNLLGCLGIGVVAAALEARGEAGATASLFLTVGLLGGFTTYSAFAHESWGLFRGGSSGWGLLHLATHVVLGIVAVGVGGAIGRGLFAANGAA